MRIPWKLEDLADDLGLDERSLKVKPSRDFHGAFDLVGRGRGGRKRYVLFLSEDDAEEKVRDWFLYRLEDDPSMLRLSVFSDHWGMSLKMMEEIADYEASGAREDAKRYASEDPDEAYEIMYDDVWNGLQDDIESTLDDLGWLDRNGDIKPHYMKYMEFDTEGAADEMVRNVGPGGILAGADVLDDYVEGIDLHPRGIAYERKVR